METFKDKVLKVVKGIKRGEVLSYKEVARRAGRPKACRAVGNILSGNFDPEIPCHRVIRSDGRIGGYNRGRKAKKELLKEEGYNGAYLILSGYVCNVKDNNNHRKYKEVSERKECVARQTHEIG